LHTGVIFI